MNKKTLVISVIAVALIVLASLSSVVGGNVVNSDEKKTGLSPLFAVRSKRSVHNDRSMNIDTSYVGKGKILNIFFSRRTSIQALTDRAFKLIEARPDLLKSIMDRATEMPEIVNLLKENGMTIDEFKSQMQLIMNDPTLLRENVDESVLVPSSGDNPMPLGLSTSNPIGCFIIVLAMAPVLLIIAFMVATVTIVTCLNVGGCFEELWDNLVESFLQGLTQPDT